MFRLAEVNCLDRVKEACSVGMVPSHPESLVESWDGNCVLISLLNYLIKPTMKHNQVLDFHLKYCIHPLHCIYNLKSNFLSVLAGTAIPFGSCRRESQLSGSNAHETFTTKSCLEEHCEWKEVSILHYSLAHWNPRTMCMWGTCYPLGIFWLWASLSNSSHPTPTYLFTLSHPHFYKSWTSSLSGLWTSCIKVQRNGGPGLECKDRPFWISKTETCSGFFAGWEIDDHVPRGHGCWPEDDTTGVINENPQAFILHLVRRWLLLSNLLWLLCSVVAAMVQNIILKSRTLTPLRF